MAAASRRGVFLLTEVFQTIEAFRSVVSALRVVFEGRALQKYPKMFHLVKMDDC